MPYTRDGKCVYKKNKDGSRGEKTGCSDSVEMAKQYLKALYAQEGEANESVDDEIVEFFDGLLVEARIKDIKAKYPRMTKLGWVSWARGELEAAIGAKASSKYLSFMMREIEDDAGVEKRDDDLSTYVTPNEEEWQSTGINRRGSEIVILLKKFERYQQSFEEKDINKYDFEGLKDKINVAESGTAEKAKEKNQAIEDSELIYDDNDILAYRPYTTQASCFWGKGTRWCISATEYENHFNDYTRRGYAFVMVMMRNGKKVERDFRKLALVFDRNGDFEELYDGPDNGYTGQRAREILRLAVAQNKYSTVEDDVVIHPTISNLGVFETSQVEYIANEIIQFSREHVQDSPPDYSRTVEEKLQELEEEYQNKLKHGYFYSEIFDEGGIAFNGGFQIETKGQVSDEMDKGDIDEQSLLDRIQTLLDIELSVYVTSLEITELLDDSITIQMDMTPFNADPDVNGYEAFLEELYEYDQKYDEMQRIIQLVLTKRGAMEKNSFDKTSDDSGEISKSFQNFKLLSRTGTEHVGDESISFISNEIQTNTLSSNFISRRYIEGTRGPLNFKRLTNGLTEDNINYIFRSKLVDLNRQIVSYLKQQLPLPGIPQTSFPNLTIPEMLRIFVFNYQSSREEPVTIVVKIDIEDITITYDNIEVIKRCVKFLDDNFEDISKIARTVFDSYIERKEAIIRNKVVENLKSLQDSTKYMLNVARKVKEYDSHRDVRNKFDDVIGWAEGYLDDGQLLVALDAIHSSLIAKGDLPEDYPEPQASSLNESLTSQIKRYLFEKTIDEQYCKVGEGEEEYMKYDYYSTEDLIDPNTEAPWNK